MKKIRVKPQDQLTLFRHLYELVSVGITTAEAVAQFEGGNAALKAAAQRVASDMRRGTGFASTIERAGLLTPLGCAILKSGEHSGHLEEALQKIVEGLENSIEFATNLKQSLMMPAINAVAALGAVFYLATAVLPKIGATFKNFGNLPDFSVKIFAGAAMIDRYWYVALLAMAGIAVAVWQVFKVKPAFLYRVPLIGQVLRYLFLATLFDGLALSQKAGTPILEALGVIEQTLTGYPRLRVRAVVREMRRGSHLDVALAKDPILFPKDVVAMVKTARTSSNYDRIIPSLARFCRDRSFRLAKKIATFAEPATLVLVGIGVLLMALSIYYPIATVGTDFVPPTK